MSNSLFLVSYLLLDVLWRRYSFVVLLHNYFFVVEERVLPLEDFLDGGFFLELDHGHVCMFDHVDFNNGAKLLKMS